MILIWLSQDNLDLGRTHMGQYNEAFLSHERPIITGQFSSPFHHLHLQTHRNNLDLRRPIVVLFKFIDIENNQENDECNPSTYST